jgi:hypothetical protein
MLIAFAASFGFGIAHHTSLAFFAPILTVVILWHDAGLIKRPRSWLRGLAAFLAPFAVNLYVVVRAVTGAPFGTEELVDANRILDHLLMRGFGGDMFAHLQWNRFLWERFLMTGNIFQFQFGPVLPLIAIVGFVWLAWQRRKQAALLGGMLVTMVFVVATYRAPQSVEYLMPAYIPIALGIGCATAWLAQPASSISTLSKGRPTIQYAKRLRPAFVALILLAILALGQSNLPSYVLLHRDRTAREYAENVLRNAPPQARILTNWHWATPLWYLQLVEGQRPDVSVEYVPPQGALAMPYAWPKLIVQALTESGRPLIVTNYYPTYIDLPYRFEPLGQAFLVRDEASFDVPDTMIHVDVEFDAKIRIVGYRLDDDATQSGGRVAVDIAWQPIVPLERDYSFFVHLNGRDGVPLGQSDRRHDAAPTYMPGEVLIDRYEFPVLLHAAPGTYRLVGGVYVTFEDGTWQRLTTAGGQDAVSLGSVSIMPTSLPPVTTHALRRHFADGITLTGIDYDDSFPAQRRVYLHWQAGERDAIALLYSDGQTIARERIPGSDREGYVTTVLDVPSGTRNLELGVLAADGNRPLPYRGAWGRTRTKPLLLPAPRDRQHYLPFGGKLALTGVGVQDEWTAGEQARVALDFVGLRPIVHDYVVSVSVHGERVAIPPSDWVPALGAIPTFKWVRDSRVRDVHLIDLPADASGKVEVALGIYDAFANQRALAPLDERLMRLGRPMVPLANVEIH